MSDEENPVKRYAQIIQQPLPLPRENLGSSEPPDPEPLERWELKRARDESEFQSSDWSLGNVLSWIAFREPVLICQFRDRFSPFFQRFPTRLKRPLLTDKPHQQLLAALQDGKLRAIRNGAKISSTYWFGKDTTYLTDDLRFRRAKVLKCFPASCDGTAKESDFAARKQVAAEPPPRDIVRETKLVAVQRYITHNYPAGIIPAEVPDKVIARATGTSERTVRRARRAKGGVGRK